MNEDHVYSTKTAQAGGATPAKPRHAACKEDVSSIRTQSTFPPTRRIPHDGGESQADHDGQRRGWDRTMRILVLGGDGYLGWPTALHLSQAGHEVAVADNFIRRHYDDELGVESLVPIEPLRTRIAAWRELTGQQIGMYVGDLTDP